MTDEELKAQLRYLSRVTRDYDQEYMTAADYATMPVATKEAADRIEALVEGWAEATRLIDVARQQYGAEKSRAEAAEAKLAKAVEALLLARVHVANNEQGWSVGRASARSDLKIINATLAEIEGTNAP
jgi:hypothetical protein